MKLNTELSSTVIIGDVIEGDYKLGDLTKIFKILHTNIYSDKVLAPIRELVCNAHDSHVAAGTKERFHVHLPTLSEPYFYIRDFGTGLTHDEVVALYTTYGASTKDNSNEAVGCFGIGSKAPFAYTDRFEVIAYKDGTVNVYQCLVDQGVPKFVQFSSAETSLPNGVMIRFDVKKSDIHLFKQKMSNMLFFQNEIKFIGGEFAEFDQIPEYEDGFAYNNKGWCVEMGGVLYTLKDAELYNSDSVKCIDRDLPYGHGYIIHVELGDIDITASRESVDWTPRSKETIERLAKGFLDLAATRCKQLMMDKKGVWDKLDAYRRFRKSHPFFRRFPSLEKVKNRIPCIWTQRDKCSLVVGGTSVNSRSVIQRLINAQHDLTICSSDSGIVFVDTVGAKRSTPGIRSYSEDYDSKIIVCIKDSAVVDFLKRLGAPVRDVFYFDKWTPEKKPVVRTGRKTKTSEEKELEALMRGIRRFRGIDLAPEPLSHDALDYLDNDVKRRCYYVLRDEPHRKFTVNRGDHIADNQQLGTWCDLFTTVPFIVVSPKVISKLEARDKYGQLVNLEEKALDIAKRCKSLVPIHKNARTVYTLYSQYGFAVRSGYVTEETIDGLPPDTKSLFNQMLKEHKEPTAYDPIEKLVCLDWFAKSDADRDAHSHWSVFKKHLAEYFPLAWYVNEHNYSCTTVSEHTAEHIGLYCKTVKNKLAAAARAKAKEEKSKNAETKNN